MKTVTIKRNLFTKQRKPQLICQAGTVATLTDTAMNGSMVIVKIEGWKDLVCIPAGDVK